MIRIHATDEFDNGARAAREGPFDKNVEKPLVCLKVPPSAREQNL